MIYEQFLALLYEIGDRLGESRVNATMGMAIQ